MPYWQLFYHIIWATKNREPILTPDLETVIYGYMKAKATNSDGRVYALNGWLDHVHMVVSIPPKIAVSKFIGQVKAVAATRFNKSGHPKSPLYWQAEYAVFSFHARRLPNYVQYVERQKEHHTQGTLIPILERIEGKVIPMVKETGTAYGLDDDWRHELESLDEPDSSGAPS